MPKANYEVTKEKISELRTLAKSEKKLEHLTFDDSFLIKFLHARNGDTKLAFERVKGYFHMRRKYPQGFMLLSEVYETFEPTLFSTQAEPGPEGEPVVYIKIANWDYSAHELNYAFASIIPFSELAALDSDNSKAQTVGFTILIDMRDWTWAHMGSLRPGQLKTCFELGEQTMPVKFRRMHICYNNKIVAAFFALAKPFMSEELQKAIVFHGDDMSQLYEEIPKSKLPIALGGQCSPRTLIKTEIDEGDDRIIDLWTQYPAKPK